MHAPIVLPDLGAGGQPIRISVWLVEPGEDVETGDRVVEVVVPGITFDVPAPVTGTLLRIDKPVDSVVQEGDVLGWIEQACDT